MRIVLISCLLTFLFAFPLSGQNSSSVEGEIKDSLQLPIAFATVSLMNTADSTLAKASLSDESGVFTIEQLKTGDYFLMVYMSGYKKIVTHSFHLNEGEKKKTESTCSSTFI